ncbi:MAG: hypothetical protein NC222_06300 [Staphylococcus sp.]|nr:hypothetical protein [Staphylococcus sp.]
MEITVYELQRKYDEFKDLSYDQLMKIAELLVKRHDFKVDSIIKDLHCEIQELKDEIKYANQDFLKLEKEKEILDNKLLKIRELIDD